jgi:Na+/phosphate symporter
MAELKDFHAKVCENFDLALAAFSTGDEELARKVLRNYTQLQELAGSLRQRHIVRLHKGLPEAVETTGIHFDVLSYLWQINTQSTRLADIVVGGLLRKGEANE